VEVVQVWPMDKMVREQIGTNVNKLLPIYLLFMNLYDMSLLYLFCLVDVAWA
jgi:hypothetical protein